MSCAETQPPATHLEIPFPLPLMPFETYMVADDRPEYPMTFAVRLHFAGRVDRDAFDAAIRVVLERNPLLTARLAEVESFGPCWVEGDSSPIVDFDEFEAPLEDGCVRTIDLGRESGLRTWVRTGDDTSHIIFQFHHAVTDGVGAFLFIEDLLVAYAQYQDDDGPEFRPLDIARLPRRNHFDIPPRSFFERLFDMWVTFRMTSRLLLVRVKPLAPPAGATTEKASIEKGAGFIQQRLSQDVSKKLRKAARAQDASLNDLLLRDLFLVMRAWNNEHGSKSGGRLRINMPTSLRSRDDRTMPAANLMSFAFLTRKSKECDDPGGLLSSLRDETRFILKHRLTLYFLGMLGTANWLGILRRSLRVNRCFATAVLTNVGDPSRRFVAQLARKGGLVTAGNLTLTNIDGVPPMRHLTRAVFSLVDYGKRLTISLRCDPKYFAPEETQELLDRYVAQLERSAG
ncbi:MAG: hypothetical protein MI757_09550 [Pirellulales bacterium]|nr:hypothetical protein [Pirellulales bacterium]